MPSLSVVILTWNEARNIEACLRALARQTRRGFEVVVVDAASTDATVEIVRRVAAAYPVPLRVHVAATRVRVGPARNLGIGLAQAESIAFLSADAVPDKSWVEQALRSIDACDMAFGRQIHAPTRPRVGSAVRGLRYHFPDTETADPTRYASNVNAVMRRHVLAAFPFGASAGESAVDDLLLAQRSARAGHRIRYNPQMVVRHRDVDSVRAEFVKNLREGAGWGEHAGELGLHRAILAWGAILCVAVVAAALAPGGLTGVLVLGALWAPAVRRSWRRRKAMHKLHRLIGVLASPVFDLAFLAAYVGGLFTRRRAPTVPVPIQEIPS